MVNPPFIPEPISRFPEPIKEEWQEQLLSLAKEPKKPQFIRQSHTNGFLQQEEDAPSELHNSELNSGINGGCIVNGHCPKTEQVPLESDVQKFKRVTSAKCGDMLYFQVSLCLLQFALRFALVGPVDILCRTDIHLF